MEYQYSSFLWLFFVYYIHRSSYSPKRGCIMHLINYHSTLGGLSISILDILLCLSYIPIAMSVATALSQACS